MTHHAATIRIKPTPVANAAARAFTLLEILIVVTIMAVIGAVAIPRYATAAHRYRADSAAKRLSDDLSRARAWAIGTSSRVDITFDVAAGTYAINIPDITRKTATTTGRVAAINNAKITEAKLAAGSTLSFTGFGLANTGASITIVSGTETRRVVVDSATGTISVSRVRKNGGGGETLDVVSLDAIGEAAPVTATLPGK